MKGISVLVAAIIMIAFVIMAAALTNMFAVELTKKSRAGVEESGETAVECGTGVIHIDGVETNGNLKVTVENLGYTDLSGLKIVVYNGSGSYSYDATPGSVGVGSKVTLSSETPEGLITRVRVVTSCPHVYDEYETGYTTTTAFTFSCGDYVNEDTTLTENITGCSGTILYINSSDVTLDCRGHYLQSTGSYGINNTGFDNVTVKNCVVDMNGGAGSNYGIYCSGADNGTIENNTVSDYNYGIRLSSSSYNNVSGNTLTSDYAYGIAISSSFRNTLYNNNINILGSVTGYAIHLASSDYNIVEQNNATSDMYTVNLNPLSDHNVFSENNFNADSSRAVYMAANTANNSFYDNVITANNRAVYFYGSSGPITGTKFIGGSVASSSLEYYTNGDIGATNSFRNTNFTEPREIYLSDTSTWFNYNNETSGGIWLNTSVSDTLTLTRELTSWTQGLVQWNDTASSTTAYYNLSGLYESDYDIYYNGNYLNTIYASGGKLEFSMDLDGEFELRVEEFACFPAGTKIAMADGFKNIEDVEPGELVLSYNPEEGRYEPARVTRTFRHSRDSPYFILINNALRVTPSHPVYSGGEWKRARFLKEGDMLFPGHVESVRKIYDKAETYNLEVDKNHNYFAGGILVHNK